MAEEIQISVIVCTYNRSDLVAQVLETLCVQAVPASTYEVIVVDNNSTDDTRAVVAEFERKYENVRYCLETTQGLSPARNRGWQEARGEYVAYTDDDCKVPPQWLAIAQEIIQTKAPAIFGGPYYPFYSSPKPTWFKDAYGSSVTTLEERNLSFNEYISEGNLFCHRSLFMQFGGFRADLGPKGNAGGSGDGTEWIIHVRRNLPEAIVYYAPKLYVYHLVKPERMSWPTILQVRFDRGRDSYLVFEANQQNASRWVNLLLKAPIFLTYLLFDGLLVVWWRDRIRYPYVENYWYEHSLAYLAKLGSIYTQFHYQHDKVARGATADSSMHQRP